VGDVCLRATHKEARVEIAVALTTDLVREAARIHALAPTSLVALGRLLTGSALLAVTGKQEGSTSVQILSRSRIGSLYADCTTEGAARGMTKTPHLSFPLTDEERETQRRSLGAAIHPGQISVIRRLASGEYGQSATPLISGEIDEDLESYLINSDQVPTLMVCDVVVDPDGKVRRSAGAIVQAMPDGDRAFLADVRTRLKRGGLAQKIASLETAEEILTWISPHAVQVEAPAALRYQCRCSRERVLASLRMFPVTDLAEMAGENESVEVGCDLCGKKYEVSPGDLLDAFKDLIKAQG
jgi:molecular chaperone Hsp33